MFTLTRSVEIQVVPYATRARMFSKLDRACDLARKKFPTSYRDPYKIKVDLISLTELDYFNVVLEMVLKFDPHRRFLNLMELLTLNFHEGGEIRSMKQVFTEEFVLCYEPVPKGGVVEDNDNVWMIRPAHFYRGQVIDAETLFATTSFTPLEEVGQNDLDRIQKLLALNESVLQSEALRLKA